MSENEKPGMGGAPKKEINIEQFEDLCGLHCTKEEIAAFFKIDADTLNRIVKDHYGVSFSVIFKQKKDIGKVSLRRSQWLLAQKNPALSIWLGKNYLKQKDSLEINTDKPIQLSYNLNDKPKAEGDSD